MSIQEIDKRIIAQAETEAAKIGQEGQKKTSQLEKVNAEAIEELKNQIKKEAEQKSEEIKRSYLVPARLSAQKSILEEKQRILSGLYTDIQKEKNLSKADLAGLREKSEVSAAKSLFG